MVGFIGGGFTKQGEAGPKLEFIGRSEDLQRRLPLVAYHEAHVVSQAVPENWTSQITPNCDTVWRKLPSVRGKSPRVSSCERVRRFLRARHGALLWLLELAEPLEGTAELRPEELRGDNARHASGCHAGIIALEQLR